ncbi:jmjC domain-containing histone demethylation protein 1-like [Schistocerca nitens]|uniref:jmjC domain-containing histone demethylation protein 1-like n=1 Tax=Schistocerca nitens TaxID=7011 RepID=UPI0021185218|nr:jmjC domain-containing histone demethylation protein 1-like [Schistocerca nitens]
MKSHYESQPVEGLGMDDNISGKRVLTRTLRDRKERKHYTDDWALGDEEIEGRRSFRLEDKMETDRFPQCFVKEMQGADFNLAYLQRHGFNTPLLFRDKAGLGLRVPSPNFSVNDVRMCVGSRRILDVMDVNTQKNVEMTMKEWQRYYDDPKKEKLLNVISLEFSHTKLENYIQTPTVVRQIDWVDCVWPRHLKEAQTESTNVLDEMMYPKVQKYCLMSVKGCYTDFHVDFGGTSVWYHILKGSKIFWLIPPTERNLQLYEQWVLSGKQGDVFFGDTVDKCGRVTLTAGNTFFIPTGWIHAVYTPVDSLVFGGNFLHSFGIEKQLKTAQVEDTTHVPQKFRYPFFTEMLWYVLERYVHCLLGRSHLDEGAGVQNDTKFDPDKHIHLTPQELHGLKAIVMFLHSLPTNKKNVPELIRDPIALIKDVRTLVERHRNDNPEAAVTGKCILQRPDDSFKDRIPGRIPLARNSGNRASLGGPGPKHKLGRASWGGKGAAGQNNGPRRRRTRCKRCEACQRSDCGECTFCLDMVKFGGPGRAKQTCIMRQCLQPMLPVTAACVMCALDGWGQAPVLPIPKTNREAPSSLMECCICYEIIHPDCIAKTIPDTEGIVNEDLPNSWECPKCCKEGKNVEYRPRHFRARAKSSDIRRMSVSSDNSSMLDSKDNHMLQDVKGDMDGEMDGEGEDDDEEQPMEKKPRSEPMLDSSPSEASSEPRKLALRTQLAHQLSANSTKQLRKPTHVVRPTPPPPHVAPITNPILDPAALVQVFRFLSVEDLGRCASVCRAWSRASIDPLLWRRTDLSRRHLSGVLLAGIVRRQPEALHLDWTTPPPAKRHLAWLIARLPQLRELSLQGCSWAGASALRSCTCPPLSVLDLSFVLGLNDASLRELLSPPPDSRPGLVGSRSRLKGLRTLRLAGCDISDVALRYITQHLPKLVELDISQCVRVTDAGVAQLAAPPAATTSTLASLDLSSCRLLTDSSLDHLARCDALVRLDLRHTPNVTAAALAKFAVRSPHGLHVTDTKLIVKKRTQSPENTSTT